MYCCAACDGIFKQGDEFDYLVGELKFMDCIYAGQSTPTFVRRLPSLWRAATVEPMTTCCSPCHTWRPAPLANDIIISLSAGYIKWHLV